MPARYKLICFLSAFIFFLGFNPGLHTVFAADTTPPSTTYVRNPANPNGKNGWFVTPVTYTLTATDLESGVKEINYKIDSAPWQKVPFADTLNLAPTNPSFETTDINSPINTKDWTKASQADTAKFERDNSIYAPGFENTSIKISSTSPGSWHAINHSELRNLAVAVPYGNMSASVWVKTGSAQNVYFKIFAVSQDAGGQRTTSEIVQSGAVSGTNDWTQLSQNFVVNAQNAIGVYIEIGLSGSGTVWVDAVNVSDSLTTTTTDVPIATDGSHILQYYSVDRAGNIEQTHSSSFEIDQTPPGNWHDSGATRGFLGQPYQLWVYAIVEDETSGISPFTDHYFIHTELNPGYGRHQNFLDCNTTWLENQYLFLITPPWQPGAKSAYIITPKTSFCNTNWNKCKIVRFYSEDMAGNGITKDFCINGPWIKIGGKGVTRSNEGINMLSEAQGDNTDGLIEAGNNVVNFFTSSKDWKVKEYSSPQEYSYSDLWNTAKNKSQMGSSLPTGSGVYYVNSNLTIDSGKIPANYNTENLKNIIFVNGDLTINNNLAISSAAAVLYIVKGDTKIKKDVTEVDSGIFSDGDFYTAHDVIEGDSTPALQLRGLFSANKFIFQRTLQGTNNSETPSENFTYEPKYITKIKDFLGISAVRWQSSE